MAGEGLAGLLDDRIRASGPISFRDFMETALYEPDLGYYSRGAPIGDGGDFVTSPSISPLFARAIARVFAKDAEFLGAEPEFIEIGAATGQFLRHFRDALDELLPDLSLRTRIAAVERSRAGRESLAASGFPGTIFADVGEIVPESVTGWIFSNELFDALPVHRVVSRSGTLLEFFVESSAGGLSWTLRPAGRLLAEYFENFRVAPVESQIAEINLDAAPLYRKLARLLARGRIVTFDYGHRAPVLYHPVARAAGTLATHSGGRRGHEPLERPGEIDLTAHVNFDDLILAGEAEGLRTDRLSRQYLFLAESGLFEDAPGRAIEALRLFDPEGLGEAISVLIQSREVPPIAAGPIDNLGGEKDNASR
jgi:SAM-dependent MidA family methyltransferase